MGIVPRITSTDYRNPYRPKLISFLNFIGRMLGRLGYRGSSLLHDSLSGKASRKTGLTDFGDAGYRDRVNLLVDAIDNEARLSFTGRFMVRQNMIRMLENRLRMEDDLKKNPGILDLAMEDPIYVVGLQRTGTTMMQRMLSSDNEHFRFLASWEAANPAPFPGKRKDGKDPRIGQAELANRAVKYLAPDFFAIHPIDPEGSEEDCLLFDIDFWSTVPEATMRVPSFSRWLEKQDHTVSYRYYKKILQYLYWQNPGGRWVLKTPQHMEHFNEIFNVFPDAKIIHTHRDPVKVIASFCSMVAHGYGIFSDDVDPLEIGKHWGAKALKMVNHSIDIRKRAGDDRIIDVFYADLIKDPVSEIEKVYEFLGIPFGAAGRERVEEWNSSNPQHRYGKHVYRLEDFGLDKKKIRNDFSAYMKAFNIPEEDISEI